MTFIDPRNDAGDPGAELYGTGPWMVIESNGPLAYELTLRAVAQCEERGVRHEVVGADKLNLGQLGVFHGLVVTVPDSPVNSADVRALIHIATAMNHYRSGRRDGIEAVLSGREPEYKAGILQIAGTPKVLDYHRFKQLSWSVCREHRIDPKSTLTEVDFFSVYTPDADLSVPPSGIDRQMAASWELLQRWGIADAETAVAVNLVFEEAIQYYDDPKFTVLFRPVHGKAMNRLQFVLFDPNFPGPTSSDPDTARKNWVEAGARVSRHVLAELKKLDPPITRPRTRRGRDLQVDLLALYTTLKGLIRSPEFRTVGPAAELRGEE
ncbi:hypothetical protein ACGFQG_32135 [Nocardia fluminea]|uniref:hypothetical protein n=1 Tax=Nocardia fluminea TaxID=134984 RepID=UPI0037216E70